MTTRATAVSGCLAGRRILVTRPAAQAAPLAAAIAAEGGEARCFPLIDIAPATDPEPLAAFVAARAMERGLVDKVRTLTESLESYGVVPDEPEPETRRGRARALMEREVATMELGGGD